jgi:hypothetical protein
MSKMTSYTGQDVLIGWIEIKDAGIKKIRWSKVLRQGSRRAVDLLYAEGRIRSVYETFSGNRHR